MQFLEENSILDNLKLKIFNNLMQFLEENSIPT